MLIWQLALIYGRARIFSKVQQRASILNWIQRGTKRWFMAPELYTSAPQLCAHFASLTHQKICTQLWSWRIHVTFRVASALAVVKRLVTWIVHTFRISPFPKLGERRANFDQVHGVPSGTNLRINFVCTPCAAAAHIHQTEDSSGREIFIWNVIESENNTPLLKLNYCWLQSKSRNACRHTAPKYHTIADRRSAFIHWCEMCLTDQTRKCIKNSNIF